MKDKRFYNVLVVAVATTIAATPAWALFQNVPEPNILALFGVGAAAAILVGRYFKKK